MEFQLCYFKSWKMMLWKCCTLYISKFWKLSTGHRTGKGMIPGDLHELKIKDQMAWGMFSQISAWTNDTWDQMPPNPTSWQCGPDLGCTQDKNRGNTQWTEIKFPCISTCWIFTEPKLGFSKFLRLWLKNLWLCGSQQTVENSSWEGNTRPPYLPPEKSVCRSNS